MCLNFLEMHPGRKSNEDVNLGVLLLDFFIENLNWGKMVPRNELLCGLVKGQYRLFCIIDPINPRYNTCTITYRAPDIKKAFKGHPKCHK